MQLTGKIEKEDESKGHIIEYEDERKEDDLSDLKKLLGKSFNLKKYAQNEEWYNEEVAKMTKDPQILIDILRKGKDDYISQMAAMNPNCPPEILTEVLRRKRDDTVSFYAANNPNCPLEYKIKWMQATNKIEKEDESKGHIIEYEKANPEDDLSDLKKLL
jgi:hypothetical protein